MSESKSNVYLIVADETHEFEHALRYGAYAAKANGAKLGILCVMPELDFTHWGGVEERMRQEQRQEAEEFLKKTASRLSEVEDQCAAYYLEEGNRIEAVTKTLENNKEITKLILGANSHGGGPGELVSYFAGKGVPHLSVPLMIVADHLSHDDIKRLI